MEQDHRQEAWRTRLHMSTVDAETCLYILWKSGEVCFLVVHVDDLLLAASSRSYINSVKDMLSSSFKMHDLGEAKYLLRVEIWRDRKLHTISLSHSQYAQTILKHTGMTNSTSV